MRRFRLDRRAVLKGAGSIAIALPFMEIMLDERLMAADVTSAKRFITFFTPGGTVLNNWLPTGSESSFEFGSILKPLDAVKGKVMPVSGLNMIAAQGEQHQCGNVALLTGTSQSDAKNGYAAGPSIDQVLASRLSEGKRIASLQMAIRWATGKTHGKTHPANIINFENNDSFSPIPPQIDPKEIWQSLFGRIGSGTTDAATAQALLRDKSILDFVDKKYLALSKKLGKADKAILEQHLTKIREMEKALAVQDKAIDACKAPTLVDTSDYNPQSGTNSGDSGEVVDNTTDAAIPKVGKFFMDMLVMALTCDLTGVATLQWTDTEAKHTFPWLSLSNHHHYYQHDGGYRPEELTQIYTWYAQQFAYLVQALGEVNLGDHSLLDETIILWGSELQEPPSHAKTNMPFVLAGNGGGLKTGRWLKHSNVSSNNLLLSILNLCGDDRKTFGKAEHTTGVLSGLT